ncbi:glycosyltransferase family 4 protein [Rhodobacterales bacterium]|nr:glycosyltransferase family 4 protein [Rhodobacterales bacterium]
MQTLYFAYPGDLETPTGGYGYDRRILAGLRDLGLEVTPIPLGDGFPSPDDGTLRAAGQTLAGLPADSIVVIDGLAFGAMDEIAAELDGHLKLVALVHHPLCLENGLTAETARKLQDSERRALSAVAHVIVTSPATAGQVTELFDIPAEWIDVVLPGTDLPAATVSRSGNETLRLLSVGTIVPRKGYDLLIKALTALEHLPWHLDIAGGLDAAPDCYRDLKMQIESAGLQERVVFHGAVEQAKLQGLYDRADIFVLASRYEGYGMAYTEALANGLPVIGSGGGAVRETLPDGAAIYCPPEDERALQSALELLLNSPQERQRLGHEARQAAERLPRWSDSARQFANALKEVAS